MCRLKKKVPSAIICLDITLNRREGIAIPNFDFITTLLNLRKEDVETIDAISNDGVVNYYVTLKRTMKECPYCSGKLIGYGHKKKRINHPTLIDFKSSIVYKANRYCCKDCGSIISEENPFSFAKFNSSYALLDKTLRLLGNLNYTLDDISGQLNISTTQINNYLDSYITIPVTPLPECLGIDEIHNPELSYKGSAYLCVMVDNENRCIYDVLGSRSKNYLDNYFYGFRQEEKDAVRYVTIDMWEPYKDLAYKHFRNCKVAVDPFHVVEHLCKDFRQLRINIMKQTKYGSNAYYLLKKWNWLLETDMKKVDLDNEPVYNSRFRCKLSRRQIMEMLLKLSPLLEEAYFLKERYRYFNRNMSYEEAIENYDVLLKEFMDADIPEYREFVNILKNWKKEILNSFIRPYGDHKLSNAFCENINGKIRDYLSVSRGIGNFCRFRKRVLYALNPRIFYSLSRVLYSNKRQGKKRGQYKKIRE